MTRTRLVLDLPAPEGIRVVIVDDADVVNVCLAMVLARFGALVALGPTAIVSGGIRAATPHAHLSEIAADEGEAGAVVQKLREPDGSCTVEVCLTNSAAAVALALAITDLDALSN